MTGIKRTPADKRLSYAIRERDGWKCQRCFKQFVPPTKGLHAAHMFSRRCPICTAHPKKEHECTRLNPDNTMALCYGCHTHVDSHYPEKEALFRKKLGDERFDMLAALAHGKRDRAVSA